MARLLRILHMIQGKAQWTSKTLAAEEECSERTIFRALQALELAGIPWYFDGVERCYRLRPDYRFPIVNLNPDEAVDHAIATVIASAVEPSTARHARKTIEKIRASATNGYAELLNDAQKLISAFGLQLADHTRHHAAIRTVQWALLNRKQLLGKYRTPYHQSPVNLRLHAYRLCFIKQAWYLIARPDDAQEVKTFRVARFRSLRMVDAAAEIPSEFDLKAYFGDAWSVYRGDKKFDAEIEFSEEAAELVTETIWHAGQKVRRKKDGTVRLHFRVDGLKEIVHWVLGWSNRAKVIKPPELRDLVVRHFEGALKLYRA